VLGSATTPGPRPTSTGAGSDREIRRCLKRYIARELFQLLEHPLDSQQEPPLRASRARD